jgi:glycosyltransferase involved in cell wall biosynthesis
MSEVSVIVASHRAALIAKTIPPLLEDPATLEAVVVAVEDAAVAAAAHAIGDPRVRVAAAQAGNPSIARQIGVERARGQTVVMLDDDVLAGPGLVGGHAGHHPTPGLVVFGYMPIPPDRLRGPLRFPVRLYASSYEDRVKWWTAQPELVMTGF